MRTPNSSAMESITLEPIGEVEAPFETVTGGCDYCSESRIILRPELCQGLYGIEYFSHLWVIYRQHRSDEWLQTRGWAKENKLILPAEDDRAGQGVFSSRAPCRPAMLGSCIVELLYRQDNELVVRGLDALKGTPVIDVKPYVPHFDSFPDAVVPLHWARVMDKPDDSTRMSRSFHWDTSNVDFALGLRTGTFALQALGGKRGMSLRAALTGSAFFAQGFEMATGCSPLRGTLEHTIRSPRDGTWNLMVAHGDKTIRYEVARLEWPDAASVFAASEADFLKTAFEPPSH